MKICWDNLEKLRYSKRTGKWYTKGYTPYRYMDSCKICNNEYLTSAENITIFCSKSCSSTKENNPNYNKKHSEETKLKISKTHKNKKISKNQKQKISKAIRDKNHPNWKGGVKKKNIPLYDTYSHQISFSDKVRRNSKDKNILEVKCTYCGKWFIPKTTEIWKRVKALNGKLKGNGESRLYCSISCKQECPIFNQIKYPKGYKKASSREVQPELRQMVFERDDYKCRKCGNIKALHCHHIEGIKWEPLESVDIDKCITYCKYCHIKAHEKENCGYQDMQCKEK